MPIYPAWPPGGPHMRRFLAMPFLAVVLSAQAQPEMVVSVGHAGAPSHAAFACGHSAELWDVSTDRRSGQTVRGPRGRQPFVRRLTRPLVTRCLERDA